MEIKYEPVFGGFHNEMTKRYGKYGEFQYKERDRRVLGDLYGVGVNDVEFSTTYVVDGVQVMHYGYQVWRNMIKRCFSEPSQAANPTYIGCNVSEEWLSLNEFLSDIKDMYVDGYVLDKDLLYFGNKTYSKSTCVFIPQELNNWLLDGQSRKNTELAIGVNKVNNKFRARSNLNGKQKHLGYFDNESDAHQAWQIEKRSQAISWLKNGFPMQRIIKQLTYDIDNNLTTKTLTH